jgi:molecular chaperone GrpE
MKDRKKEKEETKQEQVNTNNKVNDASAEENNVKEPAVNDSKKTEELELKVQNMEKELNEYKDRLIRKIAEFDNYKKRIDNDQQNFFKYAAESFIIKILPIVDDFERSFKHINENSDISSHQEGMKLIYDKLIKILNEQGVEKIDAVGKPFDVHLHEAVIQRHEEGVKPHIVLDEIQTGYFFKDKVIRHTLVVVSDDTSTDNIAGLITDDTE